MLDFSRKAVSLTQGRSRPDLDSDEVLALAITRLIEMAGEAARRVSVETRQNHDEIPWLLIIGTRDRLAHGYIEVNLDIIWQIITGDLPPLIVKLERLLSAE
jgi:uncharacterized protein with HEPN domain